MSNWLQNIRDIYSTPTAVIDEQGNELSKADISRIKLTNSFALYCKYRYAISDLQKSYNDDLEELHELAKGNEAINTRLQSQIDRLDERLAKGVCQVNQDKKEALEELKKAINEHAQVLKTGRFLYEDYLITSLGRSRDSMPQIDSSNIDDVVLHFQGKSPNAKVTKETIPVKDVQFAQGEINEDKLLSMLKQAPDNKSYRLLVAKHKGKYTLLDGHHRVAYMLELDPEINLDVYAIHLDPLEAIRRLNLMKFSGKSDINKSVNGQNENTESLESAIEAFGLIDKGFRDGFVSDDMYMEYELKMDSYIEKANANLVKKKIWVNRGGKTFQQTVYVNPNDENQVEEAGIGEIISEVAGMNIERYSDKAIIIKGDTYVNKDIIKEVKEEIGVGSWNKKLRGWVFPVKFKDALLGGLWSRLVDTDGEKAQAIQNQKNAAFENGDIVNFNSSNASVLENVSTNEGIRYRIRLENGEELTVDEKILSKEPLANDKKISEIINDITPESRAKVAKQIFGFKEIDDIHNYSLYQYAEMHGITQSDIDAYLQEKGGKNQKEISTTPASVSRDSNKPSQGLTKNQIIARLISKHKEAVQKALDVGIDIPESVVDFYPELAKKRKELSEEHKRKIAEALKETGSVQLEDLKGQLANLLDFKQTTEKEMYALYDKERAESDYSKKRELNEAAKNKKNQLPSDNDIRLLQNKIQSLENGGRLINFTDKVGVEYKDLPDYTSVSTIDIDYNEDNILTKKRPPYIPLINESDFERGGFILDMVKVGEDQYMVATNKHSEKSVIKRGNTNVGDYNPEAGGYVLQTLDQLVLTQDYYMNKKKADNKAEAKRKNQKQIEYWDRQKDSTKEFYLSKTSHSSLPVKIKKEVLKESWDKMTWQEREKYYKPVKTYGTPRLKNVYDDSHMAGSFHSMYERFLDPLAKRKDKSGKELDRGELAYGTSYAHPDVFPKWEEFREMISWKANDLKVQREEYSATRQKALETSYGESNTSNILHDELGILVKRQNGENIKPQEVEQLKNAWLNVQKSFGNLKQQAKEDGLKLSHAGKTYMYASKAIGVYVPSYMAIGVTAKIGEDQLGFTMGHEVAHWIDNTLGKRSGRRFASDNYDSTAGKIAIVMRKNINKKTENKYINSIHECFARSLEQYHAIETNGVGALRADKDFYFNSDSYVSESVYNEQLKPLIKQFLNENKELLKGTIFEAIEAFDLIAKSFDNGEIDTDTYLAYREKFELIKSRSGVYADNATNRRLKRVGKKYGSKGQEDQPTNKQGKISDSKEEKQYSDSELAEHAKNASQADLERQIKEGSDPKLREAAHKELDRREKEESADKYNSGVKDKKQEESKSYSDAQLEAIDFYQTKSYNAINMRLREDMEMPPKLQEVITQLDSAFSESEKKINTFRGVTLTGNELKKISNLRVGDIYQDKAYISTSMDKKEAEVFAYDDGNSFLFNITIPKGSNSLDLSQTSELMANEKEILLPKDSQFKITKIDGNKISMEVIDK